MGIRSSEAITQECRISYSHPTLRPSKFPSMQCPHCSFHLWDLSARQILGSVLYFITLLQTVVHLIFNHNFDLSIRPLNRSRSRSMDTDLARRYIGQLLLRPTNIKNNICAHSSANGILSKPVETAPLRISRLMDGLPRMTLLTGSYLQVRICRKLLGEE